MVSPRKILILEFQPLLLLYLERGLLGDNEVIRESIRISDPVSRIREISPLAHTEERPRTDTARWPTANQEKPSPEPNLLAP